MVNGRWEWDASDKWLPFHETLPFEEEQNGVLYRHAKVQNFFVILVEDIKKMSVFPHVISFKSSSFKTGRKLNSKLTMLEDFGAASYAKTFNLVAKKEKNEKGEYFIFDVIDGRLSSEQELQISQKWFVRLMNMDAKVHEVEETEE